MSALTTHTITVIREKGKGKESNKKLKQAIESRSKAKTRSLEEGKSQSP
jgi:hypothetical protein